MIHAAISIQQEFGFTENARSAKENGWVHPSVRVVVAKPRFYVPRKNGPKNIRRPNRRRWTSAYCTVTVTVVWASPAPFEEIVAFTVNV